ncbi:MAG TPA: hypothetical protein VNO30_24350 [Kofleriaceae bacterium]|nr:hypothetical protein [Kofleriaceae bacterium]
MPEGAEVVVVVIDDELSAEERAELHASLDCALDDSAAGRGMNVALIAVIAGFALRGAASARVWSLPRWFPHSCS